MRHNNLVLLAAIFVTLLPPSGIACTSILVGKKATSTNTVLIARTEDSPNTLYAKRMEYIPPEVNPPESFATLSGGPAIRLPESTVGFHTMPDWTDNENKRFFDQRGVNENNVVVSATNCAHSNPKVQALDPYSEAGITEENLTSLILSQASSAQHGVRLLGHYISLHRAGESFGAQIADENEAWYFEAGSGRQWIAVRIPDDKYMVAANSLRIHGVDLDSNTTLHSEDLFEWVQKHHLLENPRRDSFNFAKAFGLPARRYDTDREYFLMNYFSPSAQLQPYQDQYPLFHSPEQLITTRHVIAAFRSDYTRTLIANTPLPNGSKQRTIPMERNSEAHIIEIQADFPKEVKTTIWQSPSCYKYSPFIPIICHSSEGYPEPYTYAKNQYSPDSAWWTFRSLDADLEKPSQRTKDFIRGSEDYFLKHHPKHWREMAEAIKHDASYAIQNINRYSSSNLNSTLNKAKKLDSHSRYLLQPDQLMLAIERKSETRPSKPY